jgi:hypothetical protein
MHAEQANHMVLTTLFSAEVKAPLVTANFTPVPNPWGFICYPFFADVC